MPDIIIEGKRHRLDPDKAIGKGGEADVYDLGGHALKLFKGPDHPDLAGQPELQQAARRRIAEHQEKLLVFPKGLPPKVIAPEALAYNANNGVVGYRMRFVKGAEVMLRYGQRSFRQGVPTNDALSILCDLHGTVGQVHHTQTVIGDFNDLNVLVIGTEAYIIDADSMQYGKYFCKVFTTRFVDPLKCDSKAEAPSLIRPHDANSDWYAFTVMTMQTLLFVDPYGGIYKPKALSNAVLHNARPMHRITVFHPDVKYPKPAVPYKVLPDDLLQHYHRVFEHDERGVFPLALLTAMRWTKCTTCATEHARAKCPECATAAPAAVKQTITIRGTVTATRLFRTHGVILRAAFDGGKLTYLFHENDELKREDHVTIVPGALDPKMRFRLQGRVTWIAKSDTAYKFEPGTPPERLDIDKFGNTPVVDANNDHVYWTKNGVLWRDGLIGPDRIGDVLSGQTMIWSGPAFGFGFYRAGQLSVAFTFGSKSKGINDTVKLPLLRGQLIDATCAFTKERCWFFTSSQESGRIVNRCAVVKIDGTVEAEAEAQQGDGSWLGQIRGGAAGNNYLLMPTDDGVVMVQSDKGSLSKTKEYPDTEPFVDAATQLLIGSDGLYAVRRQEIVKLTIK